MLLTQGNNRRNDYINSGIMASKDVSASFPWKKATLSACRSVLLLQVVSQDMELWGRHIPVSSAVQFIKKTCDLASYRIQKKYELKQDMISSVLRQPPRLFPPPKTRVLEVFAIILAVCTLLLIFVILIGLLVVPAILSSPWSSCLYVGLVCVIILSFSIQLLISYRVHQSTLWVQKELKREGGSYWEQMRTLNQGLQGNEKLITTEDIIVLSDLS